MPPTAHVSLPIPEPLALVDATLLFVIQVLIAQHPDLLAPPEAPNKRRSPPPLRAARHILDLLRELHDALGSYRAALPEHAGRPTGANDDIPFDDIPF